MMSLDLKVNKKENEYKRQDKTEVEVRKHYSSKNKAKRKPMRTKGI